MKESKLSRRKFLETLAASGGLIPAALDKQQLADDSSLRATDSPHPDLSQRRRTTQRSIDRPALVSRHNPVLHRPDPLSPLTIGNGEFAFTADITGLQTFPGEYEKKMPLCTMSQWGWHTASPRRFDPAQLRLTQYDSHGRQVGYATSSKDQTEIYDWLRQNPHRLHLGRIGLRLSVAENREAQLKEISGIDQRLDLWTGILTSRFKVEDKQVTVRTAVHPTNDLLAIDIHSPLLAEKKLAVRFVFPYGSPGMQAADWDQPNKHRTEVVNQGKERVDLHRTLDDDEYFVVVNWIGDGSLIADGLHSFLLTPQGNRNRLEAVTAFSARPIQESLPTAAATFLAASQHWRRFWSDGGVIELTRSTDRRAPELERRIVLSQYLTAVQCAGSMPPQETGLTVNSWYGKFHLEMHWWHAAHFALWNRLHLLERSLGWYLSILPSARDRARAQGYSGVRWPKMAGPEGRDSPSPIGPLLIWQQPHPIFYAELCYETRGGRQTLERYKSLVFESAEFIASFASFDRNTQRYVLGPPLIPAQENHPPHETWNPTFELAYWSHGLEIAQRWRERMGIRREPSWDQVIARLSPLPVRNGVYLAHENCPATFTERNYDHPSMLGALGALPGGSVDRLIMRRTLEKVLDEWQWEKTWGWDYPLTAMTAARLGEPESAVRSLMMPTAKNTYLHNGHNWQRQDLPCYLPGNGGLLYAAAMMAAGWKGAPQTEAPGFPTDGKWIVRSENLNYSLLKEI